MCVCGDRTLFPKMVQRWYQQALEEFGDSAGRPMQSVVQIPFGINSIALPPTSKASDKAMLAPSVLSAPPSSLAPEDANATGTADVQDAPSLGSACLDEASPPEEHDPCTPAVQDAIPW